jgi:hypothetical protein
VVLRGPTESSPQHAKGHEGGIVLKIQDMLLLGEELASCTLLDDILCIGDCCGLVEARPEGFSHQGGSSCMVPANAQVDLAK